MAVCQVSQVQYAGSCLIESENYGLDCRETFSESRSLSLRFELL
jgi:hypothetical protein